MRISYAVGIDVGGTRIAAGLMERKGRVLKEARRLTPKGGPFGVIDAIIELVGEVTAGVQASELAGIGIGLPAQIDFRRQTVEFCTNLPLAGVDVRSLVMSRAEMEVTLDNDGNAAGIGESRFGAAKGARDWLMLTLGTGVGGCIFIDGRPFRGHRGLGGEVGHVVVRMDGDPCPCGGHGHLESYLSRPVIARKGREAAQLYKGQAIRETAGGDAEAVTAEHVISAALGGDELATSILLECGQILGEALVGLVNVFNPELIVVGGGIGESCPFLVDRAAEVVNAEALAGKRDVRFAQAELGNDAGVLGAAALAFDEYDSREGLHR